MRTLSSVSLAALLCACPGMPSVSDSGQAGSGGGAGGAAGGGSGGSGGDAGVSTAQLAWFSDWRTATGTTQQALYDGMKWTTQACGADVAAVVPATGLDFPTTNVFRAEYTNDMECLMVIVEDRWPAPAPGEYLYLRGYYRNAIPDGHTIGLPHPIHIGRSMGGAGYATWMNFTSATNGASDMIVQIGGGPPYPDMFWSFAFNTNQTYRIEWRIHRETASTARIALRVYDRTGALVGENGDWNNREMGSNLRTLAQSNPVMAVDDASFRLLEVGNNGPAGIMAGSARYLYWGGLAVAVSARSDAWIGAYPAPAER